MVLGPEIQQSHSSLPVLESKQRGLDLGSMLEHHHLLEDLGVLEGHRREDHLEDHLEEDLEDHLEEGLEDLEVRHHSHEKSHPHCQDLVLELELELEQGPGAGAGACFLPGFELAILNGWVELN